MRRVTIEEIEKEITNLPPQEQLKLVEKLARRLRLRKRGPVRGKGLVWGRLYGLGKGLWRGEDAQEYVNRLRADRA